MEVDMLKIVKYTLLLSVCAFGQPEVEFGLSATRFLLSEGWLFPNYFDTYVIYEYYWGLSADLTISFTKNLYVRQRIAELKRFDEGGTGLDLLSALDVDLVYILPFFRRISPLIYAGFKYEHVWGKPYNDWRAYGPKYEYRIGIGLNYAVRDRLNIYIEGQLFTKYQYYFRHPIIDAMCTETGEILGFPRIDLGCRIRI